MNTEHLVGPWRAVLADDQNYIYPDLETAIDSLGIDDTEMSVAIVRAGILLPALAEPGGLPRLPEWPQPVDVAYQANCYLVAESEDEPLNADRLYVQAQAMAAGLNAAAANPGNWNRRTEFAAALHDMADRLAAFDGAIPARPWLTFYFTEGSTVRLDEAAVQAVDLLGSALLGCAGTTAKTSGTLYEHSARQQVNGVDVHVFTHVPRPADDDPAQLRAEIEALKAQLRTAGEQA